MYIIVNPQAGTKAGIATNTAGIDTIRTAVAELGLECDIVATERAGHATELAQQAVQAGHEVIVAAGGDGTVREVLPALLDTPTVLGILPLGSAMNVARVLDIPRDVPAALALIQQRSHVAPIDIGRVNDRLFIEAAGVGITAGVLHLLGEIDAGRWRRLRTLVRYVRLARPTRLRIDLAGQPRWYRTLSLVVANAPITGAAVPVAPAALMDDGLLNVRIFLASSKRALAGSWLRIILGRNPRPLDVRELQVATLPVSARRPLLVHADDELAGTTPATFSVLPGAVAVIVGPEPQAVRLASTGASLPRPTAANQLAPSEPVVENRPH